MKTYNIKTNIGKAKYLLSYHDGVKTHSDGSKMYDIAIFKNVVKLHDFEKTLIMNGYIYKN